MTPTRANRRLPPLSFRAKVLLMILVTSMISGLGACTAFVMYERLTFADDVMENLATHAQALGHNCVAAMEFGDTQAATEILSTLSMVPFIDGAWLLTPDETVFARYESPSARGLAIPGAEPNRSRLTYSMPIVTNQDVLGRIAFKGNLSLLNARLQLLVLIGMGVMLVSLVVSWLISFYLERIVVKPVLSLARIASIVTSQGNYGLRASLPSRDEVGALANAFNQMLEEIERQQAALKAYSQDLHRRVDDRTRDLAKAKAKAEEAARSLAHSEHRFRSISSCAPIGILELQFDGSLTYGNPHLEEILGIGPDSLSGRGWISALMGRGYVEDDYVIEVADSPPWLEAIRNHQAWDGEIRVMTGEEPRWLALRLLPMTGEDDGLVGTLEDISARKRSEAEREAMAEEREKLSREAGMAAVATNVLHNVGNVLNSVNVSAQMAQDRLADSCQGELATLAQMITAQSTDLTTFVQEDPVGQALPELIGTLAETMEQDQAEINEELTHLVKNIEHIKVIVQMQQSFARTTHLPQCMEVSEFVEEALALGMAGLERHGITIYREFESLPSITVDKHKSLEIIINLLSNAKHAIQEHPASVRRLTIQTTHGETGMVNISVIDTGVGISPENLKRIFGHGFTTRAKGHGFGLHSAANGAQALGGQLQVASQGLGKGASFTLTLPLNPPTSSSNDRNEASSDPLEWS